MNSFARFTAVAVVACFLSGAPQPAAAGQLAELTPSGAPSAVLRLLEFPQAWAGAGLPAVRLANRRVRVFGESLARDFTRQPREGFAFLLAVPEEGSGGGFELSVCFERRSKHGTSALSRRFDHKVAEYYRIFNLAPELRPAGVIEVRDDLVAAEAALEVQQLALLHRAGTNGSLADLDCVLLWRDGEFVYLLEFRARCCADEDLEPLAATLSEVLAAALQGPAD